MKEQAQDFKDVKQVLKYLEYCDRKRRVGGHNVADAVINRIITWATILALVLTFGDLLFALFLRHDGSISDDGKTEVRRVMLIVLGCLFVQAISAVVLFIRGFKDWRKGKIVSYWMIDRDEQWAKNLVVCSETLLSYTRETLKRLSDRRERSAGAFMKDSGVVSVLALAFAMWKGWGWQWEWLSAQKPKGWNVDGFHMLGNVALITFIIMMVLGTTLVRATVARYTYRMELIDIAVSLKALQNEAEKNEEMKPADNA